MLRRAIALVPVLVAVVAVHALVEAAPAGGAGSGSGSGTGSGSGSAVTVPVTAPVTPPPATTPPPTTTTASTTTALTAMASPPPPRRRVDAGDVTEVGFWFGPRVFNDDALLGYIDDAPHHLTLSNSIELGVRAARPFFPWLVPEVELAFAPTHTTSFDTDVYWLEPRVHFRFELMPHHRLMPFVLAGGGATIALSSATKRYADDLLGEGYAGAGVRLDTGKGFIFRFDARLSIVQGNSNPVDPEVEIGFGLELHPGEHRAPPPKVFVADLDTDGDHIPDSKDQCPDRAEDYDGFQDADGCPDIDNDNDRVLDIADKCPNVPETYNGFQDEDGCPDTVPTEVDAIKGTIEGLLYADGETAVRESAIPHLKKIAETLAKYPSVKIVLIGFTDDRESKQFAPPPDPNQPNAEPPDLAALASDLSRARAEAVRIELVKLGVGDGKISVEGHGAEGPVSDNESPRGRLANRRVELQLFVPSER